MNLEERKKWLENNKEIVDKWIEKSTVEENEIRNTFNNYVKKINKNERIMEKRYGIKSTMPKLEIVPLVTEEKTRQNINKQTEFEYINSPETIKGINISPYLKKIRNDYKKENLLVLYIKDNKIIDNDIFTDNKASRIDYKNYLPTIIEKAKQLNAEVFDVHNHPINFSAKESRDDIEIYKRVLKKAYEDANINYLGEAVVTMDDYNQHIYNKKMP